jgi:hypothetical protein
MKEHSHQLGYAPCFSSLLQPQVFHEYHFQPETLTLGSFGNQVMGSQPP